MGVFLYEKQKNSGKQQTHNRDFARTAPKRRKKKHKLTTGGAPDARVRTAANDGGGCGGGGSMEPQPRAVS